MKNVSVNEPFFRDTPGKTDFQAVRADSGSDGAGNRYSGAFAVGKLEPGEPYYFGITKRALSVRWRFRAIR